MLFPDEPLATVIRDAFEGYTMGRFETQAEIQRFFEIFPDFPRNSKGEITRQRVKDVLTNPLYTGYICSDTYGIDWLKGHHEPLITVSTFESAQERLQGIPKAPVRKNVGDDFALRGFVCCADCGTPLRSSWSKGKIQSYAYYLCQTKGCASYGKSIARDKIEGDDGAMIKTLQPTKQLVALAKAMFRHAWEGRRAQAQEAIKSGKDQLRVLDKQIKTLLSRIMESTNATVVGTYESKIGTLEKQKIILGEQLAHQTEPKGTYEEKLEPVLTFLANY